MTTIELQKDASIAQDPLISMEMAGEIAQRVFSVSGTPFVLGAKKVNFSTSSEAILFLNLNYPALRKVKLLGESNNLGELEDVYNTGVFDDLLQDKEVISGIVSDVVGESTEIQLDKFILRFVFEIYNGLGAGILSNIQRPKEKKDAIPE